MIKHVGVDHGRFHILVTEQILLGADAIATFQQVRGEAVAERVATRVLGHLSLVDGGLDRVL